MMKKITLKLLQDSQCKSAKYFFVKAQSLYDGLTLN